MICCLRSVASAITELLLLVFSLSRLLQIQDNTAVSMGGGVVMWGAGLGSFRGWRHGGTCGAVRQYGVGVSRFRAQREVRSGRNAAGAACPSRSRSFLISGTAGGPERPERGWRRVSLSGWDFQREVRREVWS